MGLIIRNINFTGNFRGVFPQVPPPPPAPPAPSDQYGAYTVLDLPGTGTNNTNNSVFVDSSSNNFAITRYGNTTQGSFSPFSTGAGYWSNYFDGSGDYLTVPSSSAFSIPTSTTPFTIETWVYPTAAGGAIFSEQYTGQSDSVAFSLTLCDGVQIDNTTGLVPAFGYYISGSPVWVTAAMANTAISLNQWSHIAAVFTGSTSKIFINGVDYTKTSSPTPATTWGLTGNNGNEWYVGRRWDNFSTAFFTGYISNLRVVKGSAVYTTNFTPPTTPLTAVSGTSMLTCQSNRFVDVSSNAFAITRVGDTSVSAFGPFAPANSYNSATMGGSIYFDGNDDYITGPNNAAFAFGTGDFTLECWLYATNGSYIWLFDFRTSLNQSLPALYFQSDNTTLSYYVSGANRINGTVSNTLNRWIHIAITRSGTNTRLFADGQQIGSTWTDTTNYTQAAFKYGANENNSLITKSCYVSNMRVVKGTAVYTTNFTPPTAPVSAISGTSLLLNGTNSAIYDASVKNNLETVGDAKVSTSVSANGSMYFDGTGDNLLMLTSPIVTLSGDFTVECWMYPTTADNNYQYIFSSPGSATFDLRFGNSGFGNLFQLGTNVATLAGCYNTTYTKTSMRNQWWHIAWTRQSGVNKLYINGQLQNLGVGAQPSSFPLTSWTDTVTVGNADWTIGSGFIGYINDFRVTNGLARYTANFTPPARS